MTLIIRALEKTDLSFIHHLNNEYSIMSYWFEEPYQSLSELENLYTKHILDETERRFIVEEGSTSVGVVELLEINFIHRTCEVLIIIDPQYANNVREKLLKWLLTMLFSIKYE